MKILFIGQRWNDNLVAKIAGGMQLSETLQVKTLAKLGHEVFVVAPAETDAGYYHDVEFPNIKVIRSPISSKQTIYKTVGKQANAQIIKDNKVHMGMVRDTARTVNPDLIINNTFQAANLKLLLDMRSELGCGVVHVSHEMYFSVLDISIVSKLDLMGKLVKAGGSIAFVTEYQRDHWFQFFEKRIEDAEALALLKQQLLVNAPIYVEPGNYYQPNSPRCGTMLISRIAPEKRVDTILKQLKKAEFTGELHLFLSAEKQMEHDEYYQEVHALGTALGATFHINAPREELIEQLKTTDKMLVSSLQESFGIVPLEAAMYGVLSVVLWDGNKGGSAAHEILNDATFGSVNIRDKLAVTHLKHSLAAGANENVREQLNAHVFKKFSEEKFTENLKKIVESSKRVDNKLKSILEF